MRWFMVFMSTIFMWVWVCMPDIRHEGQHRAWALISAAVHSSR